MKERHYHSNLSVEQTIRNIEFFSREYGLPEAFFEPLITSANKWIKGVDIREELYFRILKIEGDHLYCVVGSRNCKAKKLDITVKQDL